MDNRLTPAEYANKKGITLNTVYRQLRAGKLNSIKEGRKYYIIGAEARCKWNYHNPGTSKEYIETECGHQIYEVSGPFKTFIGCPWCMTKISIREVED